ncbi:MAG TPA: glycosyltransferase family 4 protein [Gemmatimonadaceae bacterium]|nr:glycosyltransferase family 4 protein [Gemmatimonadaceae bacterium]
MNCKPKRRVRVALVTHELSGGVGTMTRFLYRVLSESEAYEPHVVLMATSAKDRASALIRRPTSWLKGPTAIQRAERGLPFTHVGAWFSELEFQRYQPREALSNVLRSFDILQFVGGSAPWVDAARAVDRPKMLWVATTIAGDRASRAKIGSSLRRVWFRGMHFAAEWHERRALQIADRVLALSPYTAESLRGLVKPSRLSVAYCGIDTEVFSPAQDKQYSTGGKSGYILCVGRLGDARKNVAMLLRAYSSLSRQHIEMPDLCLAGESLSQDCQQLATEAGIAHRVRTVGFVPADELAELYRGARIFVLPSDEEGLGMVLLEAMACGVPVISTASGGPQAIIDDGKTGLLTPVGDQAALEAAIARLLSDEPFRRSLSIAGMETARNRFSMAATGGVFLEQYAALQLKKSNTTASARSVT